MTSATACFVIVSRNDIPIYDAELGSTVRKEDAAHQHQFVLHAALDVVQDVAWTTSAMFLKSVDRFNDLVVSVYVTAGHTRLMLLHDSRNEDGIKSFFQEVHELYIKSDQYKSSLRGVIRMWTSQVNDIGEREEVEPLYIIEIKKEMPRM